MIRIMCDQDVQGLAGAVLAHCRRPPWEDIWRELQIELYTFADLGLQQDATDADIWSVCQDNDVILLTGNRNAEGPDSLEITIRERNLPESLPVLTFADLRKLKFDRTYLELSAERLMEKMIDIEALRGAGRIYIP